MSFTKEDIAIVKPVYRDTGSYIKIDRVLQEMEKLKTWAIQGAEVQLKYNGIRGRRDLARRLMRQINDIVRDIK